MSVLDDRELLIENAVVSPERPHWSRFEAISRTDGNPISGAQTMLANLPDVSIDT